MKVFICFALLIIFISYANTQEEPVEQNNTRVSVYLHPVYIFYFGNRDIVPIYSTVEIPFSLSNSLIIRPSLLIGNYNDYNAFRLGSDIGFRHYLFGNGEGLYLQGQIGIFYNRRNDYYECSPANPMDIFPSKSLWLNPMGYVGYSLKYPYVSIFVDVGLGGAFGINTKTGRFKSFDDPYLDFDIGIGIPFGVAKLADTQEQSAKNDNTRVSVYLHPTTMLSALLDLSPIYLTIEFPFSLYNSLIIRPSYLNISHEDEDDKAFRLGSDIGFRHYLAGKGEGLYLQGQMGIFYFRNNNTKCYKKCSDVVALPEPPFYNIYIPKKSIWLDIMGYIGYSLKLSYASIFVDVGFGPILGISTETGRTKLYDEFLPDLNIGIGVPF
ncbi:MAG: hypothetical protein LBC64_00595 [Fibromonadaceae bacterium]|jgi:hypothetical protein|nr:hypothetical protein [Fibromonadaceae bacterium]